MFAPSRKEWSRSALENQKATTVSPGGGSNVRLGSIPLKNSVLERERRVTTQPEPDLFDQE
jgi:hypothetical protein